MDRKNIILIPVDFSEESIAAIHYAELLTPMINSRIHLVHVIEDKNPLLFFVADKDKSKLERQIKEKLENIIQMVSFSTEMEVSYNVLYGNIIDTILKEAKELKTKLIIVGTTGSTDIRKKIIGSNALRIIREATCPVISIKSKESFKQINKILLPLDASKVTKQKVEIALQFAKYFNAKIELVSVETGNNFLVSDSAIMQLEEVSEKILEREIDCSIKLIKSSHSSSKMAEAILQFGKEVEADIIMVMTQQESNFNQYNVGSVAKEIIHHANIPVYSVRPKEEF